MSNDRPDPTFNPLQGGDVPPGERLGMARRFFEALPHAVALGMEPEEMGDGVAVMSMPWREDLVGDPETGVIHGGAVSALMDTCCGAAAMSHPQLKGRRPSPPADLLQVRVVGESPAACPRSRPSLAAPMNPLRSAPRTSRSATRCVQGMRCEISWIGMGRTP